MYMPEIMGSGVALFDADRDGDQGPLSNMGLLDRFRRRSSGGPAAVRARLEGAMAKRRLRGWNPPLENINALVASGGPRLTD